VPPRIVRAHYAPSNQASYRTGAAMSQLDKPPSTSIKPRSVAASRVVRRRQDVGIRQLAV
jgi:hypothetical protein